MPGVVKIKSVKDTASGALSSATEMVGEYKGWLILAFFGFLLYSFRGFFTSLGDYTKEGMDAATAKAKADAEAAVAKAQADGAKKQLQTKVQASTGTKTVYTDEQLAQFEADATSMANFLGQGNFGVATIFKDWKSAFHMMKQYSRLNLWNNKPFYIVKKSGKDVMVNQDKETAASVKNKINWKVLVASYREVTKGRDLKADYQMFVTGDDVTKYNKWFF